MASEEEEQWLAVIGRSLAYVALHRAELGNSDKVEQAIFLEGLGVPRDDVAKMLNTSAQSVGELIRQRKAKKKGKGRGRKK